jgi:O-acetyl-ADP-ribose deacetylase (regulator of RNase III)
MKEIEGNLWDYHGKNIIAITTNGLVTGKGEAVFGHGCARQARERFPGLARRLGASLAERGNHVTYLGDGIVNFPVEHTPYETPDMQLIERSARELVFLADSMGWETVVVPRPGCGGGGLEWNEVRPILERHLDGRFLVITKKTG